MFRDFAVPADDGERLARALPRPLGPPRARPRWSPSGNLGKRRASDASAPLFELGQKMGAVDLVAASLQDPGGPDE